MAAAFAALFLLVAWERDQLLTGLFCLGLGLVLDLHGLLGLRARRRGEVEPRYPAAHLVTGAVALVLAAAALLTA